MHKTEPDFIFKWFWHPLEREESGVLVPLPTYIFLYFSWVKRKAILGAGTSSQDSTSQVDATESCGHYSLSNPVNLEFFSAYGHRFSGKA